jgi:hypothetical protein
VELKSKIVNLLTFALLIEIAQWFFNHWAISYLAIMLNGNLIFVIFFYLIYKDKIFIYFTINQIVNLLVILSDYVFIDKYDRFFTFISVFTTLIIIKELTKYYLTLIKNFRILNK